MVADALKWRIWRFRHSVNTGHESIFYDFYVFRTLSNLHENFAIVLRDKVSNNSTFACKKYYVNISEILKSFCMCSNVETNLSWTCLVSGLLNFKHPSVLLFCFGHASYLDWFVNMKRDFYLDEFIFSIRTVKCAAEISIFCQSE